MGGAALDATVATVATDQGHLRSVDLGGATVAPQLADALDDGREPGAIEAGERPPPVLVGTVPPPRIPPASTNGPPSPGPQNP